MACCKCCCGNADCSEGQQGKCCCGESCCGPDQYCCGGSCQSTECCCYCFRVYPDVGTFGYEPTCPSGFETDTVNPGEYACVKYEQIACGDPCDADSGTIEIVTTGGTFTVSQGAEEVAGYMCDGECSPYPCDP